MALRPPQPEPTGLPKGIFFIAKRNRKNHFFLPSRKNSFGGFIVENVMIDSGCNSLLLPLSSTKALSDLLQEKLEKFLESKQAIPRLTHALIGQIMLQNYYSVQCDWVYFGVAKGAGTFAADQMVDLNNRMLMWEVDELPKNIDDLEDDDHDGDDEEMIKNKNQDLSNILYSRSQLTINRLIEFLVDQTTIKRFPTLHKTERRIQNTQKKKNKKKIREKKKN